MVGSPGNGTVITLPWVRERWSPVFERLRWTCRLISTKWCPAAAALKDQLGFAGALLGEEASSL
jgi:hypothetical protein